MAEEVGKTNITESKRDLTPYERMPRELRLKWEERLFNTLKLSNSLLDADSIITYAFFLWTRFTMLVVVLLAINPERFPWRTDFCFALGASLVYYALIGFMRRQSQRNLVSLCAQHPEPENCKNGRIFDGRKPYDETNDPPLARQSFRLRPYFGIPRRGFAQREVIIWQFVAALCYIVNYSWYVLYRGETSGDISLLWMLHVTMTAGGVLVLFKNAGFLIDTNNLLKTIEELAGSILGHAHATVNLGKNGEKPCEDDKDKK
ncbi:MAG: hypothetical protein AAB869_02090 [Patescibacteria group bacterium]